MNNRASAEILHHVFRFFSQRRLIQAICNFVLEPEAKILINEDRRRDCLEREYIWMNNRASAEILHHVLGFFSQRRLILAICNFVLEPEAKILINEDRGRDCLERE